MTTTPYLEEQHDDKELAAFIIATSAPRADYWAMFAVSLDYIADVLANELVSAEEAVLAISGASGMASVALIKALDGFEPLARVHLDGNSIVEDRDQEYFEELAHAVNFGTRIAEDDRDIIRDDERQATLKLAFLLHGMLVEPIENRKPLSPKDTP